MFLYPCVTVESPKHETVLPYMLHLGKIIFIKKASWDFPSLLCFSPALFISLFIWQSLHICMKFVHKLNLVFLTENSFPCILPVGWHHLAICSERPIFHTWVPTFEYGSKLTHLRYTNARWTIGSAWLRHTTFCIQEHERQEFGGYIQLYLIPKHKWPGITSQLDPKRQPSTTN